MSDQLRAKRERKHTQLTEAGILFTESGEIISDGIVLELIREAKMLYDNGQFDEFERLAIDDPRVTQLNINDRRLFRNTDLDGSASSILWELGRIEYARHLAREADLLKTPLD